MQLGILKMLYTCMRYFTACLSVFYLALTLVKDGFIMFFLMGHLFTWVKRLP